MLLSDIKGLGAKRIADLSKAGMQTPEDLILHFPFKYVDITKSIDVLKLVEGEEICFLGEVCTSVETKFIKRGLFYTKVSFKSGGAILPATFFNQRFIANKLIMGAKFYVNGKVKKFKNTVSISAPTLTDYSESDQKIMPIYRPIKGVPIKVLIQSIKSIMSSITVNSYLTPSIINENNLLELNTALQNIHFPPSITVANESLKSIITEKLANNLCMYNVLKKHGQSTRSHKYNEKNIDKISKFISGFEYKLTGDQQKAITEIISDLNKSKDNINVLLEGDVGSGKTIVAFTLLYYSVLSGFQGTLMAPTELLAKQHYNSAVKIFKNTGVRIGFLSSSLSAKDKAESIKNIKNGSVDIVIGTHSLIQKNVEFKNLSLVITDEQHRFGVSQRASLENKSKSADKIVMSATPIPRTLALTLYGELKKISIKQKPPKKASITTKKVRAEKVDDMYKYLLAKCSQGEQAFVVCPRIDDEDDTLESVEQVYANLKKMFMPYGIACIHGKIKDSEKDVIMSEFSSGKIKVLIATTVVEVGIDIKNATSMVILNAERYGLSQLHQLRGRVGRGSIDSFCFVLSDNDSSDTKSRLDYFCSNDDGFMLSEYDFKVRGAGDLLGTRQHGDTGIKVDADLIKKAKAIACELEKLDYIKNHYINGVSEQNVTFIKALTLN